MLAYDTGTSSCAAINALEARGISSGAATTRQRFLFFEGNMRLAVLWRAIYIACPEQMRPCVVAASAIVFPYGPKCLAAAISNGPR